MKEVIVDNRYTFYTTTQIQHEIDHRSKRVDKENKDNRTVTSVIGFGAQQSTIIKENYSQIVNLFTKCLREIKPQKDEKKKEEEEQDEDDSVEEMFGWLREYDNDDQKKPETKNEKTDKAVKRVKKRKKFQHQAERDIDNYLHRNSKKQAASAVVVAADPLVAQFHEHCVRNYNRGYFTEIPQCWQHTGALPETCQELMKKPEAVLLNAFCRYLRSNNKTE